MLGIMYHDKRKAYRNERLTIKRILSQLKKKKKKKKAFEACNIRGTIIA